MNFYILLDNTFSDKKYSNAILCSRYLLTIKSYQSSAQNFISYTHSYKVTDEIFYILYNIYIYLCIGICFFFVTGFRF